MLFIFAATTFGAEPNIQLPQVIQAAPIDYPQKAIDEGKESSVLLNLSIDSSGRVLNCAPAATPQPLFDDAACRTLLSYRFSPATDEAGTPLPIQIQYRLQFQLNTLEALSIKGVLRAASLKTPIANQKIRAIGPNDAIAET